MIRITSSDVGLNERRAVDKQLADNWLGPGPKVAEFEREFARVRGLDNFVMMSSGSSALHMAVHILNLPPGSEVVLPSFTWISCAQAIALCGHKPVFCDVDYDTQNVTAEHIKAKLTDKTRAVMVVHYAGRPVDIDPILALGLPVIEDAACGVLSNYDDGKAVGSKGAVGIWSFDPVKNLASPEAGGLTASPELCQRARNARYCGVVKSGWEASKTQEKWWEFDVVAHFPKSVCNDVSAAIALEQLHRLPELEARRNKIWDYYDANLPGVVVCPDKGLDARHSRFTYFIRCERRDELATFLKENGVYTMLRYYPLHYADIFGQRNLVLPNTEKLARMGLNIPLHPGLTVEDAEKVVTLIKSFYR